MPDITLNPPIDAEPIPILQQNLQSFGDVQLEFKTSPATNMQEEDNTYFMPLLKLFSEKKAQEAEEYLERHFSFISEMDDYEWTKDLRDAGFGFKQILQAMVESRGESAWNTSIATEDQAEKESWTSERGSTAPMDLHHPGCVHLGSTEEAKIHGVSAGSVTTENLSDCVVEYCGVAGLFPSCNWSSFDTSSSLEDPCQSIITIHYGYEEADLYPSGPNSAASLHRFIRQVYLSTISVSRAIKILQRNGLCCDNFTILVSSSQDEVEMVHIPLESFRLYFSELAHLLIQTYELAGTGMKTDRSDLIAKATINNCARLAITLMENCFGWKDKSQDSELSISDPQSGLHICALMTQILSVSVVSYSQGHTGDLFSPLKRYPWSTIRLNGNAQRQFPKLTACFKRTNLACMGDLVGGPVVVLQLNRDIKSKVDVQQKEHAGGCPGAVLIASVENIIDTWGPAELLSEPNSPYGQQVHSVIIRGGNLAPASSTAVSDFHWGKFYHSPAGASGFNIKDTLRIGGVTTKDSCPLNLRDCRRASEPFFNNIGTEEDYWQLVERQLMIQAGQYAVLQAGGTQSKIKGYSLKDYILSSWHSMGSIPDFRKFLQYSGVQVSICTRVARRVPLKMLIEEPMLAYIDGLHLKNWDTIKGDARLAFKGSIDFLNWTNNLCDESRDCLLKVCTFFLEVLKDTGVDREGKYLRLLWPHDTSLFYTISLKCKKSSLWARVLKDSPTCATFAAITSACLEAPGYECSNCPSPIWTGEGGLLATAVSRTMEPGGNRVADQSAGISAKWTLKNGQPCWVERPGGELWVYTTKAPNSEAKLKVSVNRFPSKRLSILRDWQVVKERQDPEFDAEEVMVVGKTA
jgi:hypothetical protein